MPGRIVVPGHGTLDFSDVSLPVEKIQTLFENGFPYLRVTSLGKETFYPEQPLVEPEAEVTPELALPAKKPPKMKT
ncbi:MAG: hypothetical protein D4R64_04885 [Porphyromonadaceae bacterium]|nr:MAG: hypothetical protein D4R64_04885 [Porphyromonadaceae bacterium]